MGIILRPQGEFRYGIVGLPPEARQINLSNLQLSNLQIPSPCPLPLETPSSMVEIMLQRICPSAVAVLGWLLPAESLASQPADTLANTSVIGSISVRGNSRTRAEVIRRELLFASGERLDTNLVRESERNLRRLLFLGDVRVRMVPTTATPDSVDISVEVRDLYSRAVSPILAGEVGEVSYGLVALDYNFLGRGQVVQATARHDAVSGNRAGLLYRNPRLLGFRFGLRTQLELGDEGHLAALSFSQPYYTLSSRWSYGVALRSSESLTRQYSSGQLAARYRSNLGTASIWAGHSAGDRIKVRPSVRLDVSGQVFDPTRDFTHAPENRRRVVVSTGILFWQPRYARTRFLQYLGRIEDLQIGSWGGASLSLSHRALGSDRTYPAIAFQAAPRLNPRPGLFLFSSFSASTRIANRAWSHFVTSFRFQAFLRILRVHTLTFRGSYASIARPEDPAQYLLGLNRGLRGYPPRSFDGQKRLLFNLEARSTIKRTPLYVLAGAVFSMPERRGTPGKKST